MCFICGFKEVDDRFCVQGFVGGEQEGGDRFGQLFECCLVGLFFQQRISPARSLVVDPPDVTLRSDCFFPAGHVTSRTSRLYAG